MPTPSLDWERSYPDSLRPTPYSATHFTSRSNSGTLYPTPWRFNIVGVNQPTKAPDWTPPPTLYPTPWVFNTAPSPFPSSKPTATPSDPPTSHPTTDPPTPFPTTWHAHPDHGTLMPSRDPTHSSSPIVSAMPTPVHFNPGNLYFRPTAYPSRNPALSQAPTPIKAKTLSPTPWLFNPHIESRAPTKPPSDSPTTGPTVLPTDSPTLAPSLKSVQQAILEPVTMIGMTATKSQWVLSIALLFAILGLIGLIVVNRHMLSDEDSGEPPDAFARERGGSREPEDRRELLDVSTSSEFLYNKSPDNASIHQLRAAMLAQFSRPPSAVAQTQAMRMSTSVPTTDAAQKDSFKAASVDISAPQAGKAARHMMV